MVVRVQAATGCKYTSPFQTSVLSCEVALDGFCKVFNACVVVLVSIRYELGNGSESRLLISNQE